MSKSLLVSLMMLGLFFVVLTGITQAGGSEMSWTLPGGEKEELRGTEFPFPVGFVPETRMTGYPAAEALETGALPVEEELRGTEFPFPVGFVPEN
jgi:hypothetical protein